MFFVPLGKFHFLFRYSHKVAYFLINPDFEEF